MTYKYAVIDIETTGLDRYKDTINYIGVGLAKDMGAPLGKRFIYNAHVPGDIQKFKDIVTKLKRHKVKLIWQNGKFDTLFIQLHYGLNLPIHHDVMLLGTAYDLAAPHNLKDMAVNYLGVSNWDIPTKEKIKPNSPLVEEYLVKDLDYPWLLFNFFTTNMSFEQKRAYKHLLRPAFLMYRNAERKGIYLDRDGLAKVKGQYKEQQNKKLAILKKKHDINWNSPAQVAYVLFNKEGLPVLKRSEKTGAPSGDAKVLKRLKAQGHSLPELLMEYKFFYGANTKFLNKWGGFASFDGRIHPSFNLTNVVTGRTSCSNPNLQQVPRNPELRNLFTAPKGFVLIEADYSQIELRVAADYAKDPTMLEIYRTGGDIHTETASTLSGLSVENMTKEARNKAKAVNFGFLYGMSAKGFINYAFDSYDVVFTRPEAERYREMFFAKYSRLLQWHKEMEIICEAMGGVENRFGRFRKLPDIYNTDNYTRSKAVRRAINSPVQGTASDLLLLSAVEIQNTLGKEINANIVGTIHDANLVEVPEKEAKYAIKEIKRIMEHPQAMDIFNVSFSIPLVADVAVGAWGSKD